MLWVPAPPAGVVGAAVATCTVVKVVLEATGDTGAGGGGGALLPPPDGGGPVMAELEPLVRSELPDQLLQETCVAVPMARPVPLEPKSCAAAPSSMHRSKLTVALYWFTLEPESPFCAQITLLSAGHRLLTLTTIEFAPVILVLPSSKNSGVNCQQRPHPGPAPWPSPTPKRFCDAAALYPGKV